MRMRKRRVQGGGEKARCRPEVGSAGCCRPCLRELGVDSDPLRLGHGSQEVGRLGRRTSRRVAVHRK